MGLEELSEQINLGKRFPGYFNQLIMWGIVIGMVALFILGLWSNDWRWSGAYNECRSGTPCLNSQYDPSCTVADGICSMEFLEPGTLIGEKPSALAANLWWLEVVLFVGGFLLNHGLYKRSVKFNG